MAQWFYGFGERGVGWCCKYENQLVVSWVLKMVPKKRWSRDIRLAEK